MARDGRPRLGGGCCRGFWGDKGMTSLSPSPLPPLSSRLLSSLLSPSSLPPLLFLPLSLRAWPPSRVQGDPGGKRASHQSSALPQDRAGNWYLCSGPWLGVGAAPLLMKTLLSLWGERVLHL